MLLNNPNSVKLYRIPSSDTRFHLKYIYNLLRHTKPSSSKTLCSSFDSYCVVTLSSPLKDSPQQSNGINLVINDSLHILCNISTFVMVKDKLMGMKLVEHPLSCVITKWFNMFLSAGWCGLVFRAPACKPKGHWLDSRSGKTPGLQVRFPTRVVPEAFFSGTSIFLSPSLPFLSPL